MTEKRYQSILRTVALLARLRQVEDAKIAHEVQALKGAQSRQEELASLIDGELGLVPELTQLLAMGLVRSASEVVKAQQSVANQEEARAAAVTRQRRAESREEALMTAYRRERDNALGREIIEDAIIRAVTRSVGRE